MYQRSMMSRLALIALVGAGCAEPLPDSVTDGNTSIDSSGSDELGSSGGTPGTNSIDGDADGSETGPVCGNGIVEAGETCDDAGQTPTCDHDCTEVVCGDLEVNAAAAEDCDGVQLADGSCLGLGFDGGTLACSAGCTYNTSGCGYLPGVPVLELGFSQIKQFDFAWEAAVGAESYRLRESAAPGEAFMQLGADIVGESTSITMPLYLRFEASYALRACNGIGCSESAPVSVAGSLVEAVGYFKAGNAEAFDEFGYDVALSDDGTTLAVGAHGEDGDASGTGEALGSGAAYVFVREASGEWSQQAYIKATNAGSGDTFGSGLSLSDDGNTLAVGAYREDGSPLGADGNPDESVPDAGAVYVFVRSAMGQWSQQAYIKAPNAGPGDYFGSAVELSGDGNTLAVGAHGEDGSAPGIEDPTPNAGAVYVFARDAMEQWPQQAYLKASNVGAGDLFGVSIALSDDGDTLAVGALDEDGADDEVLGSGAVYMFTRDGADEWIQQVQLKASNAGPDDRFGISVVLDGAGDTLAVGAEWEDGGVLVAGDELPNEDVIDAGATYIFVRDEANAWSEEAYIKASNAGAGDNFGRSVALSDGGDVLAVGAYLEDSNASGIGGNQLDFSTESGAVYVFLRDAMGTWSQSTYVKASNPGAGDRLGISVGVSGDGKTLAAGAYQEGSAASEIGGDQANDLGSHAGAVYLY